MKISKEQKEKIYPPMGMVVVEVDKLIEEETKSGIAVKTISDDSKSSFSIRHGKLIAANKNTDIPANNYTYFGECEVEKDDIVWWTTSSMMNIVKYGLKETSIIECEDKLLLCLPYRELLLRKRGDEYLGLNDNVIGRTVEKKLSTLLDLSMTDIAKPRRDIMEVVYTPSFVGEYRNLKIGRKEIVINDLITRCEVGDKVLLMNSGSTVGFLEDDYNYVLEKGLVFFKSSTIADIIK